MNAHKSRSRRRRLAHAAGLFRRYVHNRTPNRMLHETHRALRRAGWSFDLSNWPLAWLADRGFYPTL